MDNDYHILKNTEDPERPRNMEELMFLKGQRDELSMGLDTEDRHRSFLDSVQARVKPIEPRQAVIVNTPSNHRSFVEQIFALEKNPHKDFFQIVTGEEDKVKERIVNIKIHKGDTGFESPGLTLRFSQPLDCDVTVTVNYDEGRISFDPPRTATVMYRCSDFGRTKKEIKEMKKNQNPKQNYLNLRKGRW